MDRSWWTRLWIVIGVILLTLWFLIPTYVTYFVVPAEQRNDVEAIQAKLPAWAPSANRRLNLGLDLQGGIHMVMRVDTQTALQKRAERRAIQLVNYLEDKNLGEVSAEADPEQLEVTVRASEPEALAAMEQDLLSTFSDFTKVSSGPGTLTIALNDTRIQQFQEEAVEQAMVVIRRRIDRWGVAEVDVRKLGTDAIQISLPGQQDPEQAKALIGTTAQLEFRVVDESSAWAQEAVRNSPPAPESGIQLTTEYGYPQLFGPNREALLSYIEGKDPEGREVLIGCDSLARATAEGECSRYLTYVVEAGVPLTGESLVAADWSMGQTGEPEVNITFDEAGGRDFAELTERTVGRNVAIVLDDEVNSAPRITEKISGGSARITMGGRGRPYEQLRQEAQLLSLTLKAGALPAPVTIGEIRQVGASLGEELIQKGMLAALVGLVLVLIFMAVYYKRAGVIANIALVLNGLLLLAGLAFFNATLTLPGIAGFVLTLGMAVDANVLINERIREELDAGKTARAAVNLGYDRAFWTIFDANLTTLIAAAILFFMGTGPVRGFATSLIIGLIASMFTAIVVTRLITTYFVHGRNAQTVSI